MQHQPASTRFNSWRAVACASLALLAAPALADAPFGRYSVGAEMVSDLRTQLTWQRTIPAGTHTHAQAVAYCASFSLSGAGWRLPSIAELMSIADVTRYNPSLDATAFPNTPGEDFWTSSLYAGGGGSAWSVNFLHGSSNIRPSTNTYRIRCVR